MFPFPLDSTSQTEDLFIHKAHNINCHQPFHLNTFLSAEPKHPLAKAFGSFLSQSSTSLSSSSFLLSSISHLFLWHYNYYGICAAAKVHHKSQEYVKEVRHPQFNIILHFLTLSTITSVSPLPFQQLCPILRFYPMSSLDVS